MERLLKHQNGQWTLLKKSDESMEKHFDKNRKDALGVSPDGKGRLSFSPHFGQKEFRQYVEERADHMKDSGYAAGGVDDFNWHYEPEYDITHLIPLKGSVECWKTWYDGEWKEWQHDMGDARKGHFEKWAKNPETKPIIIVEGTDGKPHQIDGHHRTGMAFKAGLKTIPTIYGRKKTE